jgi:hypothetical protein
MKIQIPSLKELSQQMLPLRYLVYMVLVVLSMRGSERFPED